jgi:hypothetical protein
MSRLFTLLFGIAFLFGASAFAKETNKTTLQLSDDVTVDGRALNPGTYTVEWDGSGPNVQVTLLQRKDTVTTFPARLTEEPTAFPDNAYGTTNQSDGSKSLTIYPGGKRSALQVDQNAAGQQSGTHPSP